MYLITPESLEAMFIKYGNQVGGLFSSLAYAVIDEVHSFMGTERGKQLQSLLHRLDVATGQVVPRVGLSATIGDMKLAADFLRPDSSEQVNIICSKSYNQVLKVLALGYKIDQSLIPDENLTGDATDNKLSSSYQWVANKLFSSFRGTNNLVFPNSRASVEIYSDKLRKMCEDNGLPNEFWPHHGNLSKQIREETELALKTKDKLATAICTNTLELGIDIGSVKSVVQIGPPPSVASLRQRLGPSGREKGEPAILWAYCIENSIDQQSKTSDLLREELVQTIAMIRLLMCGWCEPVTNDGLQLSTLVQQLLSGIAQYGGLTASSAWKLFCEGGPFKNLTKQEFATFLQGLGQQDVIAQDHTGLLTLGALGEKLINHHTFYAAFKSDEEYRIIFQGKTLGSLPISKALMIGSYLIFAGRRWRIEDVSEQQKTIIVLPDKTGCAPLFCGDGGKLHDRVREEMREVLRTNDSIPFLNKTSASLLDEARYYYSQLGLDDEQIKTMGKDVNIYAWKGDNVQDTFALMIASKGLGSTNEGLFISVESASTKQVRGLLLDLLEGPEITADELSKYVRNKQQGKWDWLLPDDLLNRNYASMNLDVENTLRTIHDLVNIGF